MKNQRPIRRAQMPKKIIQLFQTFAFLTHKIAWSRKSPETEVTQGNSKWSAQVNFRKRQRAKHSDHSRLVFWSSKLFKEVSFHWDFQILRLRRISLTLFMPGSRSSSMPLMILVWYPSLVCCCTSFMPMLSRLRLNRPNRWSLRASLFDFLACCSQ